MEGIRWSECDVKILRDNYGKIPNEKIKKMLSKEYSVAAIKSRAQDFGFAKSRIWSSEEELIVKEYYDKIPIKDVLQMLPDRTITSLLHKAQELNIKSYFYLHKIYSKEENDFLINNYLIMTNEELSKIIGRSENSISQHLYHLNLYRPYEVKKDGYKDLVEYIRSRLWN